MTEAEWLAANDPEWMLHFRDDWNERKLRLFAVACCHSIRDLMTEEADWFAVEVAERFADSEATAEQLLEARQKAMGRCPQNTREISRKFACARAAIGATDAVAKRAVYESQQVARFARDADDFGVGIEQAKQVTFVRDIFGNPFRPVTFSPSWHTDTALSLAQQMYDSRDFGAMPILADALQDAGCDNEDILNHCRDENGVHVRGCWVVDLVLDKM